MGPKSATKSSNKQKEKFRRDFEKFAVFFKNIKVYDLEQPRFYGIPFFENTMPVFFYALHRHHENSYDPSRGEYRTGADGFIFMSDHSGTHIDALCHMAFGLKLYSDLTISPSVETPWGFNKLSAEDIPPIIRRGLLLDVPKLKGKTDPLPSNVQITAEDLEECCRKEGVSVKKGDVVLIRTGTGRYWFQPDVYKQSSGISKEADLWLIRKGVVAVGIDNLTWDPHEVKDEETGLTAFGHYYLLIQNGIYIMENLNLEEISSDQCYEFIFICTPLKIRGATGSPIRPIALVPHANGEE